MSGLKKLCDQYFGSEDLYEALGTEKDASIKDLKKAYYKLSLSVHPDRVDDSRKEEATEKFKVLGKIYAILTDPDKKKLYDENGIVDEDSDGTLDSWLNYWSAMFTAVTEESISKYEKEYKGSQEEIDDIKKAYNRFKGNIDMMHEHILFLSYKDEPRLIEIVKGLIEKGELVEYKIFTNEPKSRRIRRHNKLRKEEQQCLRNKKKQKEIDDLAVQLQKRRKDQFTSFIANLENKYKNDDDDDERKIKPVKRLSKTSTNKKPKK
uniref:Putative molecular chaperone dnaj superfamily corethrella appendiculata n=1 Tax=Xenopsylla cheopis TaxID=163159 RepID=A0A6M2DKN1_XENCH